MTRYKLLTSLLLLILALSGCEKDDICAEATPTTPTLILRFYDFANPDETKSVSNLRISGIDDNDEEFVIFESLNTDSIAVPLHTDMNSTRFIFHLDYAEDNNGTPDDESDDIILGNPDEVTMAYEREEVYVSRACGFKTVFNNVTMNAQDDGERWIVRTETINELVENELSAHIKVLH